MHKRCKLLVRSLQNAPAFIQTTLIACLHEFNPVFFLQNRNFWQNFSKWLQRFVGKCVRHVQWACTGRSETSPVCFSCDSYKTYKNPSDLSGPEQPGCVLLMCSSPLLKAEPHGYEQTCKHTKILPSARNRITPTSFQCRWLRARSICPHLWDRQKRTGACSLHMVSVSHVFHHSGCFLPHTCQIKQHAAFNNFVRWLNVVSSWCYFDLSQRPGIGEAGGSRDLPRC